MTRLEAVRERFLRSPNVWIDGHEFVRLGGFAGFTARIRDLRKPPYHWQIDNRVRYEPRVWGTETVTEYRYRPAETLSCVSALDTQTGLSENSREHGGQSRA